MMTGTFPAITPVQVKSVLTFVAGQLISFGLLDAHRAQVLLSVSVTVVSALWPFADAYLRAQRAHAYAGNPQAFHDGPRQQVTTVAK